MWGLILVGGLLVWAKISDKVDAVQMLSYTPRRLKVLKRSWLEYLTSIPLELELSVRNETRESLTFDRINGYVSLMGESFAFSAMATQGGTIAPMSSSPLRIRINVGTDSAINLITRILKGQKPKQAIVRGKIFFNNGGVTLPIDSKFDFSVFQ